MALFRTSVRWISDKLKIGGAICLVGMSLLTCVDVVGRMLKHPVFGSVELVSLMGVLAVALALPYTHDTRGHIGVELLVRRLPERRQAIVDLATGLLSLVLFGVVAWRMALYALRLKAAGEVSMNLALPEYLVVMIVAFCFLVLAATILVGMLEAADRVRRR